MIEELKLLIPLLRDAGQGAFWLVVILLAKEVLVHGLYCSAIAFAVWTFHKFAANKVAAAHGQQQVLRMLAAAGFVDADGDFMHSQRDRLAKLILTKEVPKQP